jgi:hypothetical protein
VPFRVIGTMSGYRRSRGHSVRQMACTLFISDSRGVSHYHSPTLHVTATNQHTPQICRVREV